MLAAGQADPSKPPVFAASAPPNNFQLGRVMELVALLPRPAAKPAADAHPVRESIMIFETRLLR